MGPTWGRQDPGGPHVGPMNLAIWVWMLYSVNYGLTEVSVMIADGLVPIWHLAIGNHHADVDVLAPYISRDELKGCG